MRRNPNQKLSKRKGNEDVNDDSSSEIPIELNDNPGESTDYHSKLVMLHGERHDEIIFTEVVRKLSDSPAVPEKATIVQRTDPYFGPKLVLHHHDDSHLLTAPGPNSQLLLWSAVVTEKGQREGWEKLAEVTARLADDLPPYDFCPQCGDPLNTLKHEKQAVLGCCPNR